ncbi:hypothetical protein LTR53_018895, partial [Teratosphaeriaceae sp. CCFEE 6253]
RCRGAEDVAAVRALDAGYNVDGLNDVTRDRARSRRCQSLRSTTSIVDDALPRLEGRHPSKATSAVPPKVLAKSTTAESSGTIDHSDHAPEDAGARLTVVAWRLQDERTVHPGSPQCSESLGPFG